MSRILNWFRRNAEQLVWTAIPLDGTHATLTPNETYFRLTLCEMFLARDRDWFRDRHPAVQSSVQLTFAGQDQPVTFSCIARPAKNAAGPGFLGNFPLTPLLPYRGGTVELEAALVALRGESGLEVALDVLSGFSSLLGPPLTQALTIAGKVADGAEQVIDAGVSDVELALHETWVGAGTGANLLRPGYWALVHADERDVAPAELRIESDRLHILDGTRHSPLQGYDYVLLRIDGARERPDWRLPHFERLRAAAISAHFDGNRRRFEGYRDVLLADVLTSPDLSDPDRIRVACALRDELADLGTRFGAVAETEQDLAAIIAQRAPSFEEARHMGVITLEELLAG